MLDNMRLAIHSVDTGIIRSVFVDEWKSQSTLSSLLATKIKELWIVTIAIINISTAIPTC